ncbi:MAG: hypothetical protein A4E38_01847 [Methanoregulaceae archaeon PtaB.Bin108]|jgi:hypothetical protein|nr:MAG: hypothetical protein A4E38_01847 [Methanoregulaceae archaeon PtaB.Bin108]
MYLSLLGRSAWALLNTYYAVARETRYNPDTVYIAVETPYQKYSGGVTEGVQAISRHFGFSPEIECIPVGQGSIVDVSVRVHPLIMAKKKEGAEVAIDITPGRKATVAGVLLPIKLNDVDHVFYLEISTTYDVAKPYQMIPRQFHQLHDFKAEAVRAYHDT